MNFSTTKEIPSLRTIGTLAVGAILPFVLQSNVKAELVPVKVLPIHNTVKYDIRKSSSPTQRDSIVFDGNKYDKKNNSPYHVGQGTYSIIPDGNIPELGLVQGQKTDLHGTRVYKDSVGNLLYLDGSDKVIVQNGGFVCLFKNTGTVPTINTTNGEQLPWALDKCTSVNFDTGNVKDAFGISHAAVSPQDPSSKSTPLCNNKDEKYTNYVLKPHSSDPCHPENDPAPTSKEEADKRLYGYKPIPSSSDHKDGVVHVDENHPKRIHPSDIQIPVMYHFTKQDEEDYNNPYSFRGWFMRVIQLGAYLAVNVGLPEVGGEIVGFSEHPTAEIRAAETPKEIAGLDAKGQRVRINEAKTNTVAEPPNEVAHSPETESSSAESAPCVSALPNLEQPNKVFNFGEKMALLKDRLFAGVIGEGAEAKTNCQIEYFINKNEEFLKTLLEPKNGKFSKLDGILNEEKGVYSYQTDGKIDNHANNILNDLSGYDADLRKIQDNLARSKNPVDIQSYHEMLDLVTRNKQNYINELAKKGFTPASVMRLQKKIEDLNS